MNRKQLQIVLWGAVVLGIMLVMVVARTPLYADDDGDYMPNQVVVKLNPAAGTSIADIHASYGTSTLDTLLGSANIYLLQIGTDQNVDEVVLAMRQDSRLLYAEPNFIGGIPEGDPSGTWGWGGYDPAAYLDQYAATMLKLAEAHTITLGDHVVIAVVDTGIQSNHPYLAGRLTTVQYDFIGDDSLPGEEANGLDGDNDGLLDEGFGHGTHVAGVAGLVAPAARIMPLRVLDSDGRGNDFILAEAIQFAVQNGADVINLSLGTPTESYLLEDVVKAAEAAGIVVVAAAGNMDSSSEHYPAAINSVLAVTAVGPTAVKAPFANYGVWVDIAAPGQSITSAFPTDGYVQWSGTSMATAFVSGQAALIRSQQPYLSPRTVSTLIRSTAQSIDGLNPNYSGLLGTGLIDVTRSLNGMPAGGPLTASCGQIVTTNVVLLNDLQNCPGDGLVIGADGITVDLNGRLLDGIGLGSGVRNNGYHGVTITNGTMQEFDYGVSLTDVMGNVITAVTGQMNQEAGFWLEDTERSTLQGSTAVYNSFGVILSGGTTGTFLVDNVVTDSSNTAVRLDGASSNTLRHNTITTSGDTAIELIAAANGNRLEANSLSNGSDAGIVVEDSNNNELIANTIHQMSDSGIVLDTAHQNVVEGNDLRFNAGAIELSTATGNLIKANNASHASGSGIEIGDHSLANMILSNTASFNGAQGIIVGAEVLTDSLQPGNVLERNTVVGNQSHGIAVNKAGHTLIANIANDNQDWGIYAESGNSGSGNSAVGNVQSGQCYNIACSAAPPPPEDEPTPDVTPPETVIQSGPQNGTLNTSAVFTFVADEAGVSFLCGLDGTAFIPCMSPVTYNSLSVGVHTFLVQAVDSAGNADPTSAQYVWTIALPPVVECGPTITLVANADAWIEQNSPYNNKGADSILKVKAQKSKDNFRALVRFPLPAVPAGCMVETAVLRLYASSWKNGRTLQAFQIADNWSEMGVTWSNQPATAGVAAATSSGSGYRQWHAAEQVQAMFNSGNYGFLIRDAVEGGSGFEQQFHAREKGEFPPLLVITFVPED